MATNLAERLEKLREQRGLQPLAQITQGGSGSLPQSAGADSPLVRGGQVGAASSVGGKAGSGSSLEEQLNQVKANGGKFVAPTGTEATGDIMVQEARKQGTGSVQPLSHGGAVTAPLTQGSQNTGRTRENVAQDIDALRLERQRLNQESMDMGVLDPSDPQFDAKMQRALDISVRANEIAGEIDALENEDEALRRQEPGYGQNIFQRLWGGIKGGSLNAAATNTDAARTGVETFVAGNAGDSYARYAQYAEWARQEYEKEVRKHGAGTERARWLQQEREKALEMGGQKLDDFYHSADNATVQRMANTADKLAAQSQAATEYAKSGASKASKLAVDLASQGVQMVPDAVANLAAPGAGLALMGVRSFGGGTQKARQAGADLAQQMGYGAASASVEVLTEKMFDGLAGIYGKGFADGVVEGIVDKLAKGRLGPQAVKLISGMSEEAIEELVAGAVDPMLENLYDPKAFGTRYKDPDTYADIAYSMLIGGLMGGIGTGGQLLVNNVTGRASGGQKTGTEDAGGSLPQSASLTAPSSDGALNGSSLAQGGLQADGTGAENLTSPGVENAGFVDAQGAPVYTDDAGVPQRRTMQVQNMIDRLNGDGAAPSLDEVMALPNIVAAEAANTGTPTFELPGRDAIRQTAYETAMQHGSWNGQDYSGAVRQDRRMDIVLGLPGSGKSSVYTERLSQEHGSRVIDTDDYRDYIPEYNGTNAALVHDEASAIKDRIFETARENGDNILLSTIGADGVKLAAQIQEYQAQGYDVYLHLNELPNNKAMARAIGRYVGDDKLGRYVSPALIASYGDKPTQTYLYLIGQGGTEYGEQTSGSGRNRQKVDGNLRAGGGPISGSSETTHSQAAGGGPVALAGYDWYNNDVAYGQPPRLVQSSEQIKSTSAGVNSGGDGIGAANAGFNKDAGPQVPTQNRTVTEGAVYSDGEKRMVAPGTHEQISEAESLRRASEYMYEDAAGNVDIDRTAQGLLEAEHWDSVQEDAAMLTQQLAIDRARQTGQWNIVRKLAAKIEAVGTKAGQALQARKKWVTRSGTNIVTAAAQLMDAASKKTNGQKLRRNVDIDGVLTDVSVLASQYDAAMAMNDVQAQMDALEAIIRRTAEIRRTARFLGDQSKLSRSMEKALAAVKSSGNVEFMQTLAANGAVAVAGDTVRTRPADAALQWRRMAMLSKISTVLRNLVSNNVFNPVESVSNNIAVPLDMLLAKHTGTRSVAGDRWVFSPEYRKGAIDAINMSHLAVGLDVDTDGSLGGRYEMGGKRTFSMSGNLLARFLSTMEKWQGYALNTTDEMQKGAITAEQQRGIDQLKQRKAVTDDSLSDAAAQQAKYATFQNDSRGAQAMLGLRKVGNAIIPHLGDVVIPFAQVPGNLANTVIDYSPVGLVKGGIQLAQVIQAAHDGTLTAAQQRSAVQSLGRGLNGMALIGIAAGLAAAGIMKVSDILERDDDEAALDRQGGENGTQINLDAAVRWLTGGDAGWRDGDKLVSIDFLDPINGLLTIGGLLAEDWEDGDRDVGTLSLDILEGGGKAFLDLPMMDTLKEFSTNIFSRGKGFFESGSEYAAGQVSSFLPNIVKGIAQGTDDRQRNAYTSKDPWAQARDNLKAGIPGLRQTLPTKQDSYGREMDSETDPLLRFLNANIMPGKVTTMHEDALTKELRQVNAATDRSDVFPDRKPPEKVTVDGNAKTLTDAQKRRFQSQYGSTYMAMGDAMRGTKEYRNAGNSGKADLLVLCEQYATQTAKSNVFSGYKPDAWVTNAKSAQTDLGLSPAEFLAAYQKYGKGDGILSGNSYDKTVTMVQQGGLTLDEWDRMRKHVDADKSKTVTESEVIAYLDANFSENRRAAIYDAYKGNRKEDGIYIPGWKNPYK